MSTLKIQFCGKNEIALRLAHNSLIVNSFSFEINTGEGRHSTLRQMKTFFDTILPMPIDDSKEALAKSDLADDLFFDISKLFMKEEPCLVEIIEELNKTPYFAVEAPLPVKDLAGYLVPEKAAEPNELSFLDSLDEDSISKTLTKRIDSQVVVADESDCEGCKI